MEREKCAPKPVKVDEDVLNRLRYLRENYSLGNAEEITAIIDDISRGKYLDPRNVSHVVVGQNQNKRGTFSPKDKIDFTKLANGFWVSTNGNEYALWPENNHILIFSPSNEKLVRYLRLHNFKTHLNYGTQSKVDMVKRFINGEPQVKENPDSKIPDSGDWAAIMIDRRLSYPTKDKASYSWEDFADCYINLEKGEVTFYS